MIWTIVAALSAPLSCADPPTVGFLTIKAPRDGTYDIYKFGVAGKQQFVAEQVGHFNKRLALAPGSYLVLSDCSSESVMIYPDADVALVAHTVEFEPPRPPGSDDSFSIQCNRSEETRSRQNFLSRYVLNILDGPRELLVGMVPKAIDFGGRDPDKAPQSLKYKLAAVQVADYGGNQDDVFFVSPRDELISVTKPQPFGTWEFLLPGDYLLEVNGTTLEVGLSEGEERVVIPAFVRVSVSDDIDLGQASRVKGSPQLVEINTGHWLDFNQTYPTLPGPATLRISGSSRKKAIDLVSGETLDILSNTIQVDLGCAPWEWSCLGGKDISLYVEDTPYPFVESSSDVPVVHLRSKDDVIFVGIEGSRDIKYQIPDARDRKLSIGYAQLIPKPTFRQGQVTDLVRVESIGPPMVGNSLDLILDKDKSMPLISGTYRLAHYYSLVTNEGDRKMIPRNFTISAGETITLEFPVYLNEKNYQRYRKRIADETSDDDMLVEGDVEPAPKAAEYRARKVRPIGFF